MNFRSDNEAPVNSKIMEAIIEANQGFQESYGYDDYTVRLEDRMKKLFGCWCEVIPLTTGTAANSLATALSTPPYGAMYCSSTSHMNQDECGAPEFFADGAKLVDLGGDNGKIDLDLLERTLAGTGAHGEHECLPSALSVTQCTEAGTVYSLDELKRLKAIKNRFGLWMHMDGARFANALVTLGCSAAEMTWKTGVDLLSFGATKNGAMMAEALVIFDPKVAIQIKRRRKRAGHLISKMRYISAQLLAYLDEDLWLDLAKHANTMAARFYNEVKSKAEFLYPVEANEAFLRLPVEKIKDLRDQGFEFHVWPGSDDIIRLVFSHATTESSVEQLISSIQA